MADPASITGLVNRWRADSIAQSSGSAVTSWTDSVGSVAISQATGTNQPTYQTGVLSGQPVVRFDGTNDLLAAASPPTVIQPATVAFVVKLSVSAAQQLFLSTTAQLWSNGAPWAINLGGTSLTGGTTDTSWHVITALMDTTAVVYDNGTQIMSGSSGTAGLGASRLQVGQFSTARNLNGDIAEILVYSQALGSTDRSTLHSYVQDLYGITVSDYVATASPKQFALPSDQARFRASVW